MTKHLLHQKKIAIVVANGFEQAELTVPKKALEDAGASTHILSPEKEGSVIGYHGTEKGDVFPIDIPIEKADVHSYDALLLPGGLRNPDRLRRNPYVLDFVRHFFRNRKPVAAICHGALTLIDAGVLSGRKLTSYPSIQTDLRNAGAFWLNEAVVVDNGLVTSRSPEDLPVFCKEMISEFQKGRHQTPEEAAVIQKLGELIRGIQVAMITTRELDGSLRSRPMASQQTEFDGVLWFFTSADSAKVDEIAQFHKVNIHYSNPSDQRYVSISGRAYTMRDRGKAEELWNPSYKAWFPKGLEDPSLVLLRVEIDQAEHWDAAAGRMMMLWNFAKFSDPEASYPKNPTEEEGALRFQPVLQEAYV